MLLLLRLPFLKRFPSVASTTDKKCGKVIDEMKRMKGIMQKFILVFVFCIVMSYVSIWIMIVRKMKLKRIKNMPR